MDRTLRTLTAQDLEGVRELQQAYAQAHPGAALIPGEVYLSPGFGHGRTVFCAFEPDGRLAGMAPLFPNLPGRIWVDIKVHPAAEEPDALRRRLLERLEACALELIRDCGEREAGVVFQYLPSDKESIAFVKANGYAHRECVFQMRRDLRAPIPALTPPEGLRVCEWRMESEVEQRRYVEARSQAFPRNPVSLEDWQYFMQSPQWSVGTCLSAFDGEELAGSAAVYWDPAQDPSGERFGDTEYIFVLPKWRGRGLARCLVARGLAYLREHGLDQAHLEVSAKNESALGLYTGLGYRVVIESWFLEKVVRDQG